jgi:predicted ester cyclase
MSVDRNKAIVRRLFEVWNTGKLDTIEELYAADYVADYRPYAPLRHGHDAIKGIVQRAHVAFPDYHEELEEMIAEGDKVVVRLTTTGTELGHWDLCRRQASGSVSRRSSFCASSTARLSNNAAFPTTSPRYANSASCQHRD